MQEFNTSSSKSTLNTLTYQDKLLEQCYLTMSMELEQLTDILKERLNFLPTLRLEMDVSLEIVNLKEMKKSFKIIMLTVYDPEFVLLFFL